MQEDGPRAILITITGAENRASIRRTLEDAGFTVSEAAEAVISGEAVAGTGTLAYSTRCLGWETAQAVVRGKAVAGALVAGAVAGQAPRRGMRVVAFCGAHT